MKTAAVVLLHRAAGMNGDTSPPTEAITSMATEKTSPAVRCSRPPLRASMDTQPDRIAIAAPPMWTIRRLAAPVRISSGAPRGDRKEAPTLQQYERGLLGEPDSLTRTVKWFDEHLKP